MSGEAATPRALITLALLELSRVGTAGARRAVRQLQQAKIDPAAALRSPEALGRVLPAARFEEFNQALDRVHALLDQLGTMNARVIVQGDTDYPSRLDLLGDNAPICLMSIGNQRLLDVQGIGFCGSRKASERGLAASADLASQLGERQVNVISGYAAGVDTAVHTAALEAGGTTTIVLPLGILHFRVKTELRHLWDWERVLVVSEFPARLPWQARNAMRRNATICALSDALVVVEAGAEGGTIEAGRTGLELGLPVFALQYNGDVDVAPGNRLLVGDGAHPLGRSRISGRANVERVLETAYNRERGHLSLL